MSRLYRYPHLLGCPELDLFRTQHGRIHAVNQVTQKIMTRRFWLGVFAIMYIDAGLIGPIADAVRPFFGLGVGMLFRGIVATSISLIVILSIMRISTAQLLRAELLGCRIPICVLCGYLLFGLQRGNCCPECGCSSTKRFGGF